jgi:hypothetical protein
MNFFIAFSLPLDAAGDERPIRLRVPREQEHVPVFPVARSGAEN